MQTSGPIAQRQVKRSVTSRTISVSHLFPTEYRETDPELAAVNAAWPTLPEALRAGILAMVKAAKGGERR